MSAELIHKKSQRRLLALDQCLRLHSRGMTRQQITKRLAAQGLELSLSTFNRDIRALRDLQAPLGNDYRKDANGISEVHWFYRDPSWTLSKLRLTDGTLFSLLVAQRIMEQFEGLPVAAHLRQAFDEISDALNRKVSIRHDTLVPISFSAEKPVPVTPHVWAEVARATMQRRRLEMVYQKGWGKESGNAVKRIVEPYHIVNLQGTWYLLATASLVNKDLRQYALTRITQAKALSESFLLPTGFDIDRILGVTFGQFIGDPDNVTEVHVRFNKRVAPLVMSRQFSAWEQKTTLSNGDIDLKFPASAAGPWPLYHVKSWVLSGGVDAEVLAPESLRTMVRDEVRTLAKRL